MVKKVIQKGPTKFSNSAPKWRTPKNNQFFSKSKTSLLPKIIDVHLVAGAKSMGSNWQKGTKILKEHTRKVWTEAKAIWHKLTHVGMNSADRPILALKGKCAFGPFLSILVIKCQHKCLNVNLCPWMDKLQITSKGMFLSLSTLF
jgi:hypothetical protein